MSGSNSECSTFDEYPKDYIDVPRRGSCMYSEKGWIIHVHASSIRFDVRRSVLALFADRRYEFVYQIILINKYHLKRKLVVREVGKLKGYKEFSSISISNAWWTPSYNQYNFQVVAYAIIDKNGLRKLNFDDKNVYGKSMTVYTSGGILEVPVQFINLKAPILAKLIRNLKQFAKLYHRVEEFFQVFHGVHAQLEEKEIRSLLDISAQFEVLNVKRYCEQQLIWREDLKVSEKRKFKMACKYNLNILMNKVLSEVKTKKNLAKLALIAIEMESMDTNISKLLIAKMYQVS